MACTVVAMTQIAPVAVGAPPRGSLATVELDALGRVGRALADDTRRRILVALLDGPCYPTALAERLSTSKANVSNHLACLRGCGLVTAIHEGRRVRYDLADPRLADALGQLVDLVASPHCPEEDR